MPLCPRPRAGGSSMVFTWAPGGCDTTGPPRRRTRASGSDRRSGGRRWKPAGPLPTMTTSAWSLTGLTQG
jgi:hypothetical protein